MCVQTKSELVQGTTVESGVCLTGSKCPVICGASEIIDWFEAIAGTCVCICVPSNITCVWCTEECKKAGVAADRVEVGILRSVKRLVCVQTKSELVQGTTVESGVCLTGSKCPVICEAGEIIDWFEAAAGTCVRICVIWTNSMCGARRDVNRSVLLLTNSERFP